MSSTPDRTKFSSKKFTARIDINWDWISSCFSSMCFIYHSISWFVSVISHFGITYQLFWGLFFLFIRIARLLEACSSNKAKHLEFSGPKNQPEDCCHLGKGKCSSPGLSISVWASTSMIFNFETAHGWKWQRWQGGVIVEENLFKLVVISVKCFKDAMFSLEQLNNYKSWHSFALHSLDLNLFLLVLSLMSEEILLIKKRRKIPATADKNNQHNSNRCKNR